MLPFPEACWLVSASERLVLRFRQHNGSRFFAFNDMYRSVAQPVLNGGHTTLLDFADGSGALHTASLNSTVCENMVLASVLK
jgi:hypothetical protein